MISISWNKHIDDKTKLLGSEYYLDKHKHNLVIKYEIKIQYSLEKYGEIECYILTTAVGQKLPHHNVYDNYFEGMYYTHEKTERVFFDMDKAKKYAERLAIVNS